MSVNESKERFFDRRSRFYSIDGASLGCAKRLESQQLQLAVEAFKAKGGKIDVIPMGMSSYMNDLEKANHQKKFKMAYQGRVYQ